MLMRNNVCCHTIKQNINRQVGHHLSMESVLIQQESAIPDEPRSKSRRSARAASKHFANVHPIEETRALKHCVHFVNTSEFAGFPVPWPRNIPVM